MIVILILSFDTLILGLMILFGSDKNIESRTEREEEIFRKKNLDS